MSKRGATPATVSYRDIRRRLFDENMVSRGTQTMAIANSNYATNWQWSKSKVVLGRNANKRKLLEDSYLSYILRWQSLSAFDQTGTASLGLNHLYINAGADTDKYFFPMYLFDLSTLGIGKRSGFDGSVNSVNSYALPMYRLYKKDTSDPSQSYFWEKTLGIFNSPDGTGAQFTWAHEHVSDTGAVYEPAVQKYLHEWSDIRMIFKSATTRPSNVVTKLIQFTDESYGPQREVADTRTGTPVVYDGYTNNQEIILRESAYWDAFWGTKESNPIRSIKNDTRDPLYKTMFTKKYDLSPENNNDSDSVGQQKVCKLFVEHNKHFETIKGIGDKRTEGVLATSSLPQFGYKASEFKDSRERECTNFPDKDKITWLMIYATTFHKDVGDQQYFSTSADSPSFDIVVRNKFTMNAGAGTVS